MNELTQDQQAARAVGMAQGIPEQFAIDCTGIAVSDITIGRVVYKAGDKAVRIYDSRTRDFLRKARVLIVTRDAFLMTSKPSTATIPSGSTADTEDHHGSKGNSTGEGDEAQQSTGTLHESAGEPPAATASPKGGSRRRRTRSGG